MKTFIIINSVKMVTILPSYSFAFEGSFPQTPVSYDCVYLKFHTINVYLLYENQYYEPHILKITIINFRKLN